MTEAQDLFEPRLVYMPGGIRPDGDMAAIKVDADGCVIIAKEHAEQLQRIEDKLDQLLKGERNRI